MNTHYTYGLLLVASLAGPLLLSFDKKVAFYKQWKYLFPAMVLPALLYMLWDIYFTSIGVWSFNENYIIGLNLANLPVEEVLFFFVVPYCCVFIYECIRCYFPHLQNNRYASGLLLLLAFLLLMLSIVFHTKNYTAWTFFFCALFILLLVRFKKIFHRFDAMTFLVSYAIILIPFLIINGVLTALPVVSYNDAENLGLRIYSIPIEDCIYGMLLVMMDIAILEWLRGRTQISIGKGA